MYLLSGSIAYDTILLHKGQFHARILPEALSRLNVAFGMDSVEEEFGGTAGNIAYNATLLGQTPLLCASVGAKDFSRYEQHLQKIGLDTSTIRQVEDKLTGHAWILTDTDNNQITGFFAGGMKYQPILPSITPDVWHLAPDSVNTTAWLASQAVAQGKKYFFDPGQALPSFLEGNPEILKYIVQHCAGIFVNEYECQLMEENLKTNLSSLVGENTQFIVETFGSKGLYLITISGQKYIGVAKPDKIVDPTGCGDAFRAGFLYAYTKGWNTQECAQLGSTMGSFAIEESGGQNHKPTYEQIMQRYQKTFPLTYKKLKN